MCVPHARFKASKAEAGSGIDKPPEEGAIAPKAREIQKLVKYIIICQFVSFESFVQCSRKLYQQRSIGIDLLQT